MTSENLISGTEHSGNRALPLLCLRRGCSLVTVSPGASVLLTSVPASGRGKNISVYYGIPAYLETRCSHRTGTARVTTHYSADDTIHNCQQHCSVKFDFTIFQFQHLSTSGITRKWTNIFCVWLADLKEQGLSAAVVGRTQPHRSGTRYCCCNFGFRFILDYNWREFRVNNVTEGSDRR